MSKQSKMGLKVCKNTTEFVLTNSCWAQDLP